jgi:RNA polymerase sigma-70 factor (ECF subfamily)
LVLAARGKAAQGVNESLETLCKQYWPPLYDYVRHRGYSEHDAQDLTQAYFARLLEKGWLEAADRERGRFRAFLLMTLKRFLANEWDRAQSLKRGGGVQILSSDALERVTIPDADAASAELIFERRWAVTMLEAAMRRLRSEYESAGRTEEYEHLKPCLTAERGGIDYDTLATALDFAPASARSAVHRLRKRFREIFREEVASTVDDPAAVDDEMRAVIGVLRSR